MNCNNNAFENYIDDICNVLPNDRDLEKVIISSSAEKRILKNIRRADNPFLKTLPRRIITLAATVLLVCMLPLSVRAIREPFFEFTSKVADGVLSFSFDDLKTKTDFIKITPCGFSQDFHLVYTSTDADSYVCVYQSGDSQKYLTYQQNTVSNNFKFDADVNYANFKQRYVGEYCSYIIEQKGNTTLILFTSKYTFHISSNLSVQEIEDIAYSITESDDFKKQKLNAVNTFFEPSINETENTLSDFSSLLQGEQITSKQKEEFFDIARKYHFGSLPSYFTEQEKPDFTDFMYYAYAMSPKEEQADFRGKSIENVARNYFGITYDLADDDIVSMPVGSLRDDLFAELVGYSCESLENDLYKVTAVFVDRNAFGLYYLTAEQQENWEMPSEIYDVPSEYRYAYDVMKQTGLTPFETVKHIITRGDGEKIAYMSDDPNYKQQYYTLTYTSKDGITPEKFLSSNRFYSK